MMKLQQLKHGIVGSLMNRLQMLKYLWWYACSDIMQVTVLSSSFFVRSLTLTRDKTNSQYISGCKPDLIIYK